MSMVAKWHKVQITTTTTTAAAPLPTIDDDDDDNDDGDVDGDSDGDDGVDDFPSCLEGLPKCFCSVAKEPV